MTPVSAPLVSLICLIVCSGCEELGLDARGEISNSAVQRVGVERTCLPYSDVANVSDIGKGQLEFVLRDGTRWRNVVSMPETPEISCQLEEPAQIVLFDSDASELCSGDQVLIGDRTYQLSRYEGRCQRGSFRRI